MSYILSVLLAAYAKIHALLIKIKQDVTAFVRFSFEGICIVKFP